MSLFLENPLPIWTVGAVLTTFCLVMVAARKSLGTVLALVAVILLTLLLVFLEKHIVTDREQVEEAVMQLTEAIESNALSAILALVDPEARQVRADAEALLPLVDIKDASATTLRVDLDESSAPPHATAYFRGRVDGVHSRSGGRMFFFDLVEIDWRKSGDRWLIVGYRVFHRGQPIDAVRSVRRN